MLVTYPRPSVPVTWNDRRIPVPTSSGLNSSWTTAHQISPRDRGGGLFDGIQAICQCRRLLSLLIQLYSASAATRYLDTSILILKTARWITRRIESCIARIAWRLHERICRKRPEKKRKKKPSSLPLQSLGSLVERSLKS